MLVAIRNGRVTGRADVPAEIVDHLRSVCLALPEAYEESAWVGTRWRIRTKTFAHVLTIDGGWPPAYARAAATDGPAIVLTFESTGPELDALSAASRPSSSLCGARPSSGWCSTPESNGARSRSS